MWLEALRDLCEREREAERGWVLSSDLLPRLQQAVESAAGHGLVELADREMRAELSVYAGWPILWAARLSPHGRDVVTYTDASPDPAPDHESVADGERLVELYRTERDALRLYVLLGKRLRVQPAEGLGPVRSRDQGQGGRSR